MPNLTVKLYNANGQGGYAPQVKCDAIKPDGSVHASAMSSASQVVIPIPAAVAITLRLTNTYTMQTVDVSPNVVTTAVGNEKFGVALPW